MKLIYLTAVGVPTEWAHSNQIMEMCGAFAERGIDVELVVAKRRNEVKSDPFIFYGLEKKFKITKIFCLDLAPNNPGFFYFWLRLASFLFFSKLYLLFKKYDILYTREQLAGLFFNDFVLELHSFPEKVSSWQRKVWHKSGKIVVITSFLKNNLVREGIKDGKILVAPDGVNLKNFTVSLSREEARKKNNLPLDKKIIFYHGSFFSHNWKGVDVLLESAKYFPEGHLLVLVGGSTDEINQAKKIYSADNVLFVGHRPYHEIPYYLKAADIMILPNKKGDKASEEYTSPMKLFEYMASGAPIVASDLPSIREVLNDKNSVLVEPNLPEDLARGIEKIAQNDDLLRELARQSLLDVQNFTWQKRAESIIKFITNN